MYWKNVNTMNKYFCLYNPPHIPTSLFSYNKQNIQNKAFKLKMKTKVWKNNWKILANTCTGTRSKSLAKWSIVEPHKTNAYPVHLCAVLHCSKFEGCLIIDKFSTDLDIASLLHLSVIICEDFFLIFRKWFLKYCSYIKWYSSEIQSKITPWVNNTKQQAVIEL